MAHFIRSACASIWLSSTHQYRNYILPTSETSVETFSTLLFHSFVTYGLIAEHTMTKNPRCFQVKLFVMFSPVLSSTSSTMRTKYFIFKENQNYYKIKSSKGEVFPMRLSVKPKIVFDFSRFATASEIFIQLLHSNFKTSPKTIFQCM